MGFSKPSIFILEFGEYVFASILTSSFSMPTSLASVCPGQEQIWPGRRMPILPRLMLIYSLFVLQTICYRWIPAPHCPATDCSRFYCPGLVRAFFLVFCYRISPILMINADSASRDLRTGSDDSIESNGVPSPWNSHCSYAADAPVCLCERADRPSLEESRRIGIDQLNGVSKAIVGSNRSDDWK